MNDLTRDEVEARIALGEPLDLHGLRLRQISLADLDLSYADLSHADLGQSNLTRASLREASLSEANLDGTALVEARLSGANLRGASLNNAILRDANLRDANLRDADLRGADLRDADLRDATLADADLSDVDLHGADLRGAELSGAQLEMATLSAAILQRANMISASLQDARLDDADLREARLSRASFERATLARANLQGAVLTSADLRGTDLRGATLFQADLRGARYDRSTRWPEGFEPHEAGMIFGGTSYNETMLTSIWPGRPYPLGATWDGQGVNFAIFAERATRVELCLFDSAESPSSAARITMPERSDSVWHVYLPNLRPGQLYGYRVYGPYNPDQGMRFNPNKLLLDPYAKAISGDILWDDSLFGYTIGHPDGDRSFDERDSAPAMPRSIVIDNSFPWGEDRHPRTPLHQSVIYELHVGGFTMLHPELPEPLRGTYAGLATPPVIDYLSSLGVTAVELLPVHQYLDDRQLVERGLRNYWGYNTIGFFAPDPRYSLSGASGEQVREFKSMVKSLHAAGIEVILDVVYNHTAEGNQFGPTLSLRGTGNQTYYRLVSGQPRYYMDYTGCGNTLNVMHPRTLQLIMDSLRYWVLEMHVDGFRFDLASALARGMHEEDRLSAFLDIIHQDPVLSQVKLIAEPWDIGPDGYQVGRFPVLWSEWNGKYRDTVRRFWRGDEAQVGELAYRLAGSSDLYQHNGRRPSASINFVTAHDGFTLRDLVSYNEKHNEDNGEGNSDGESHNNSWNCGAEGPSDDPQVEAVRLRQMKNMMATQLLSQGVPMLLAGDERARTQRGNNNAYCQDNEISWLDWRLDEAGAAMLDFTRRLVQIRREHPVLRRRRFFQGRRIHGSDIRDILWLRPDGEQMSQEEWERGSVRCLGMLLNGQVMNEWGAQGRRVYDDVVLLALNAHYEEVPFLLPFGAEGHAWELLIDTVAGRAPGEQYQPGERYPLEGRSLALLIQRC
ncbi:glycogen debranching protein GlgX [Chloroflexales bacterium ZM16-3]|nr:glycogen debranching protein GlgX [Chloroflexales bacterium ZM16-3]